MSLRRCAGPLLGLLVVGCGRGEELTTQSAGAIVQSWAARDPAPAACQLKFRRAIRSEQVKTGSYQVSGLCLSDDTAQNGCVEALRAAGALRADDAGDKRCFVAVEGPLTKAGKDAASGMTVRCGAYGSIDVRSIKHDSDDHARVLYAIKLDRAPAMDPLAATCGELTWPAADTGQRGMSLMKTDGRWHTPQSEP